MPIQYKPANLSRVPGLKPPKPIPAVPTFDHLQSEAPAFAKLATFAEMPGEQQYTYPTRPGFTGSKFANLEQIGFNVYSGSRLGMGFDPAPPTVTANPSMVPQKTASAGVRFGSADISIVDPILSFHKATGEFLGLDQPIVGYGGSSADPGNWLAERNIDLSNAPTRMLDYAASFGVGLAQKLMGAQVGIGGPHEADGSAFFPFESDPMYWMSLDPARNGTGRAPSDDELQAIARNEASKYSSYPEPLAEALFARFKFDRDTMVTGMSSGNDRTDYMAKKELEQVLNIINEATTHDTLGAVLAQWGGAVGQVSRGIFTLVPGGTQAAQFMEPVSAQAEEVWQRLTPDQRRSLMGDAQWTTIMTDLWAMFPMMSGAGALAEYLKAGAGGAEFMQWAAEAGKLNTSGNAAAALMNTAREAVYGLGAKAPFIYKGYTGTMWVMNRAMAVGVASMTANWALESMFPAYAESVGHAIDASRPFSDSSVAAVLNNIGYFSSATFGAATAARTAAKLPGLVGKGLTMVGPEENRVFQFVYGGGRNLVAATKRYTHLDDTAVTPAEFEGPLKADIQNGLGEFVEDSHIASARRIVDETPADLAHLPHEQLVAMANDELEAAGHTLGSDTARLATLLQSARETPGLRGAFALTDEARRTAQAVASNVRNLTDAIAETRARTYSEAWWLRQFRRLGIVYDAKRPTAAYAEWLVKEAARKNMKVDIAGLRKDLGTDLTRWRQFANMQHAHEYNSLNAELREAASVSVDGLESGIHPDDVFLMRADHIFADQAEAIKSAMDQMNTPTAYISEEDLRTAVARLIRTTKEGDEWWAKNGHGDPASVDLAKFRAYLDEATSLFVQRHPVAVTGPTADLPINQLARRLASERVYAVAYKPKENLVAHRTEPVRGSPQEFATRVSRTIPDGYVGEPPVGIRAALDDVADGQFHVTMDRDAVLAEGLRARRDLIAASGDTLMYHGTGATWFQYDVAKSSDYSLIGRGLYLTDAHRLARSYADNAGGKIVKEFRIPGDAKIWDTMAPLQDDFFAAVDADLAKGEAGGSHLYAAAVKANRLSGDSFDPDFELSPAGDWGQLLDMMVEPEANGQRGSYFDLIVGEANAGTKLPYQYQQEFRNAINEIMADAGYEGLTHTGGLVVGGKGNHKVIVLFDPQVTLSRAQALGTGAGGNYKDAGQQVSLVVNQARAEVIANRYRLAIQASRGEVNATDVVQHFEDAYAASGRMGSDLWLGWWSHLDDVLGEYDSATKTAWDRLKVDVMGVNRVPYNRSEALSILDGWFTPGTPYRTTTPSSMGELAILLDQGLEKGNPLKKPMDANFAYDPAGWARYSTEISQAPDQLAKMDPNKVGILNVARRGESPPVMDTTPQITSAEIGTAPFALTAIEKMPADQAVNYLYRMEDPASLADILANGMRPERYGDAVGVTGSASPIRWTNPDNLPDPALVERPDAMMLRLRYGDRGVGHYLNLSFDSRGGYRYADEVVPNDLIEVWGLDGQWHNLGRMDRLPQDPTPSESIVQWLGRLDEGLLHDGTPIEKRDDSVFVAMSGGMYDQGMRTGTFEPVNSYDDTLAYLWQDFFDRNGLNLAGSGQDYIVEMDRNLAITEPQGFSSLHSFVEAPKQSVKRVWLYDQNKDGFFLQFERGRGVLGEGQFYSYGSSPAEIRAASNHLWVYDDAAAAPWAGWRDTQPVPLDNAWEQPWHAPIEDPTLPPDGLAQTEPTYRYVSYVRTKSGDVLKAPWRDYPTNPLDIQLGNRSFLGHKFDSIFQGVRSWKMADHQLAEATRVFGGTYGFTSAQIEEFKGAVDRMARSDAGWSPFGKYGRIRVTPYATTKFRHDEVQKIGERIFGKGEVQNRTTGQMETPDYAKLMGDAYQQAFTMNMTAGLTSRVKQFDLLGIGPTATAIADWFVPLIRYKASPVFRSSELVESKGFNVLRGSRATEAERRQFAEAGLAPQSNNLLAGEFGTEPMMESLFTPSQSGAVDAMGGIHTLADIPSVAPGATGPAASYAIWRDTEQLFSKQGVKGLLEDIKDPTPYKNGQMLDMQIQVVRRDLPLLIQKNDPQAYGVLHDVLKVPDDQMAAFIVEDRVLYQKWQRGQIEFEDLLAHSYKYDPARTADAFDRTLPREDAATMKAIYESEDWAALETLMRAAAMSGQIEAFGVHFFGAYRSAIERSINHPMLGIYPASWMYKAAKEWVRFMYDNRVFGNGALRLGMFPAVATREIINKVNVAVAQNSDQSWQDWLDKGPAANWLFLWNLLLPGDWSSLPLPMARPIRSLARAIASGRLENLNPVQIASESFFGPNFKGGMGVFRDFNLMRNGTFDLYHAIAHDTDNNQFQNLVDGLTLNGVRRELPGYSDLVTYPYSTAP